MDLSITFYGIIIILLFFHVPDCKVINILKMIAANLN